LRNKSDGRGEIRGITRIDDMAWGKKIPDGLVKTVYKFQTVLTKPSINSRRFQPNRLEIKFIDGFYKTVWK
jgi:hypothetical protein